jgi:hypothetical protein
MTPKEKAEQLVDKFDDTLTYLKSKSKAKQCALIAVDEILEAILTLFSEMSAYVIYWQEVKEEIEKL